MRKLLISLPLMLSVAMLGFTMGYSQVASAYVYCHKHCAVKKNGKVVCWRHCYRTGWHRGWDRGGWRDRHWHRW